MSKKQAPDPISSELTQEEMQAGWIGYRRTMERLMEDDQVAYAEILAEFERKAKHVRSRFKARQVALHNTRLNLLSRGLSLAELEKRDV